MTKVLTTVCLLLFIGANAKAAEAAQECRDNANLEALKATGELDGKLSMDLISREKHDEGVALVNVQLEAILKNCKATPLPEPEVE